MAPQLLLAGADILTQLVQGVTAQLPHLLDAGAQAVANFVSGIAQWLPDIISAALALRLHYVAQVCNNPLDKGDYKLYAALDDHQGGSWEHGRQYL